MLSPVHRALTLFTVSLPLALFAGSCRPESELGSLFSEESLARSEVFLRCEDALEKRLGKRLRLPHAARDYHIRELPLDHFEIRSVVDLLDAEGDRQWRSRFRCAVELRADRSDFFIWKATSVVLTIDALDSPRRHALWPWPGFDGLLQAPGERAGRSGPAQ